MNTWRYGIAVGVLAGLGACSNMMGHNTASEAPKASMAATEPTVSPEMVKQVQAKLRSNGYYKQGNVDGVWGSGTESAVRSFQQDHNLGSSGQLDVPTLQALNVTRGHTDATGTTMPNSTNGAASTNGADTTNPGTPTQPTNSVAPPADNTAPGPSH